MLLEALQRIVSARAVLIAHVTTKAGKLEILEVKMTETLNREVALGGQLVQFHNAIALYCTVCRKQVNILVWETNN
jgi:hypothetical protein